MNIDFKKLIFSIFVCQLAGVAGSFFTMRSLSTWYAALQKPDFTPPGWVIGAVWVILYTFMGIALYLVWKKGLDRIDVKIAVSVFAGQLFLNFVWTFLFFGMRLPFYAFIEIVLLLVVIAVNIALFYRIDKKAGLLLVPYIAWTAFAAFLNYSVWVLN
jgi:benzodiazapine receptor